MNVGQKTLHEYYSDKFKDKDFYNKFCKTRSESLRQSYLNPSLSRIKSQACRDLKYLILTYGRYKYLYFYIIKVGDLYKFGVSISYKTRMNCYGTDKLVLLYRGSTKLLSKLEYLIKVRFRLYGEFITYNKLNDLIEFINKRANRLIKINFND